MTRVESIRDRWSVIRRAVTVTVAATLAVATVATAASFALTTPKSSPSISDFAASTKSVSEFGGPVQFTATLRNSKNCTMSVTPRLSGFPAKTTCTSSSYSLNEVLPVNATKNSIKYTFKLTASKSGSTSKTTTVTESAVTAAATTSWSGPTPIETVHGVPTSISCGSSSSCVIVDANGNVDVTGSSLVRIDSNGITSVSCPTDAFCLAVDQTGDYSTYDGSTWSPPISADSVALTAVSCVSADYCVAVDQSGNELSFNGTAWSNPSLIDTLGVPDALSCGSVGNCEVIDGAGDAATESDSTWSNAVNIDTNGLTAVSCLSTSSCVATDDDGNVVYGTGTSWSGLTNIDGTKQLTGISCVTGSPTIDCQAVDADGNVVTYDGTSWGAPTDTDGSNEIAAVSCSSATSCGAVDVEGTVLTLSGDTWSHTVEDGTNGYFDDVSCTSTTNCVGVGTNGEFSVFNGTSWSVSSASPVSELETISCVGSFCAAGGDAGKIVTRTGSKWGKVSTVGGETVTAIDCLSSKFCAAANIFGQYSLWNGSTWSVPLTIDVSYGRGFGAVACYTTTKCVFNDHEEHNLVWRSKSAPFATDTDKVGGDLSGVSCPTTTLCLAVDVTGYESNLTFSSSDKFSFATMTRIDTSGITSISCANAFYCGAVDQGGDFLQWFNGKWSKPVNIDSAGLVSISCSANGRCVALDQNDAAVTTIVK